MINGEGRKAEYGAKQFRSLVRASSESRNKSNTHQQEKPVINYHVVFLCAVVTADKATEMASEVSSRREIKRKCYPVLRAHLAHVTQSHVAIRIMEVTVIISAF